VTLTPGLKHGVEKAGDEPVRVEDPKTHTAYLIVREDVFRRLYGLTAIDHADRSLYEFGELRPDPLRSSTACRSQTGKLRRGMHLVYRCSGRGRSSPTIVARPFLGYRQSQTLLVNLSSKQEGCPDRRNEHFRRGGGD
jgi:hypothetical protein